MSIMPKKGILGGRRSQSTPGDGEETRVTPWTVADEGQWEEHNTSSTHLYVTEEVAMRTELVPDLEDQFNAKGGKKGLFDFMLRRSATRATLPPTNSAVSDADIENEADPFAPSSGAMVTQSVDEKGKEDEKVPRTKKSGKAKSSKEAKPKGKAKPDVLFSMGFGMDVPGPFDAASKGLRSFSSQVSLSGSRMTSFSVASTRSPSVSSLVGGTNSSPVRPRGLSVTAGGGSIANLSSVASSSQPTLSMIPSPGASGPVSPHTPFPYPLAPPLAADTLPSRGASQYASDGIDFSLPTIPDADFSKSTGYLSRDSTFNRSNAVMGLGDQRPDIHQCGETTRKQRRADEHPGGVDPLSSGAVKTKASPLPPHSSPPPSPTQPSITPSQEPPPKRTLRSLFQAGPRRKSAPKEEVEGNRRRSVSDPIRSNVPDSVAAGRRGTIPTDKPKPARLAVASPRKRPVLLWGAAPMPPSNITWRTSPLSASDETKSTVTLTLSKSTSRASNQLPPIVTDERVDPSPAPQPLQPITPSTFLDLSSNQSVALPGDAKRATHSRTPQQVETDKKQHRYPPPSRQLPTPAASIPLPPPSAPLPPVPARSSPTRKSSNDSPHVYPSVPSPDSAYPVIDFSRCDTSPASPFSEKAGGMYDCCADDIHAIDGELFCGLLPGQCSQKRSSMSSTRSTRSRPLSDTSAVLPLDRPLLDVSPTLPYSPTMPDLELSPLDSHEEGTISRIISELCDRSDMQVHGREPMPTSPVSSTSSCEAISSTSSCEVVTPPTESHITFDFTQLRLRKRLGAPILPPIVLPAFDIQSALSTPSTAVTPSTTVVDDES